MGTKDGYTVAAKYDRALTASIIDTGRDQLDSPSFSGQLWRLFRDKILDTISALQKVPGCSADTVMQAFGERVTRVFHLHPIRLDAFPTQVSHE